MKEDLVSYETAQLAKEVGFDWPTKRLAVVDLVVIRRPTQCHLAKWLREEKGIDITIYITLATKEHKAIKQYGCLVEKWIDRMEIREIANLYFDDFHDAFETGLQEALKYLKENEEEN